MGQAVTAIETAHRMKDLPMAEEAFRSGRLTGAQAAEIASAAALAPEKQKQLLEVAETEGIAGLRQECRRVAAAACSDQAERAERLHKGRYLRTFTDTEGAFRLDGRLTPEAGAEVKASLDFLREELFQQARRQRVAETTQALEADALVEMARAANRGRNRSSSGGPKALVNVRVDHAALVRGHTNNGEVCEVPGVGPIPVAAAQDLMNDSILRLIVTKGGKIVSLTSPERTIPAKHRTALLELYPECVVKGCHETKRLEIDHVVPRVEGGSRSLENLVRLCTGHHRLKTHRGYRLAREKGKWRLIPPEGARARASPSTKGL